MPYLADVSIVDRIIIGYRCVIRRFAEAAAVVAALTEAGIAPDRFRPAVEGANAASTTSFEIDLNEAQKLSLIQTDSTE